MEVEMRYGVCLLGLALLVAAPLSGSEIKSAKGEVSFDDPTGDLQPSSSGEEPGRDVVKFHVASDGTNLSLSVTLSADVSGTMAGEVICMYIDTDNNADTGTEASWGDRGGFEFEVDLPVCIEYENGGQACAGGAGEKATAYYAVAKVKDTATGQQVTSTWDLPQTPIEDKVVQSLVSYADLGVKAGQTIRFYTRESDGPYDETSYFPEVALTLK